MRFPQYEEISLTGQSIYHAYVVQGIPFKMLLENNQKKQTQSNSKVILLRAEEDQTGREQV